MTLNEIYNLPIVLKYELPELPHCKIFYTENRSLEHDVVIKCMNQDAILEDNEIDVLNEAIRFYEEAFSKLKSISLSNLTLQEALHLKNYLNLVFSMAFPIAFDLEIDQIYRVTTIEPEFTVKGKVRDPKFLSYPLLPIVKRKMRYNRANSYDYTVFYGSLQENVAIMETKPIVGSTIIISKWVPATQMKFVAHPISSSRVENNRTNNVSSNFRKTIANYHPLFSKVLELNLDFLSSEFVKNVPITNTHRFEYLFSAYFADKTLELKRPELNMQDFDLIIYPSVAFRHKEDNVAIHPNSVKKLRLAHATEYLVQETFYDKVEDTEKKAVKLKFIREATWFEKDQIIWEDE